MSKLDESIYTSILVEYHPLIGIIVNNTTINHCIYYINIYHLYEYLECTLYNIYNID